MAQYPPTHRPPGPPPGAMTSPQPPKQSFARRVARVLSGVFGTLIGLISLPMVIALFADLAMGADNITGALVAGTFFALTGLLSLFMLYFAAFGGKKKAKTAQWALEEWQERQILSLAQREGGVLSIASLALHSQLSTENAQKALEELERRQVATTWIDDAGALVYRFPAFSAGAPTASNAGNQHQADLAAFDRELQQESRQTFDFSEPEQAPNQAPHHHMHHHKKNNS